MFQDPQPDRLTFRQTDVEVDAGNDLGHVSGFEVSFLYKLEEPRKPTSGQSKACTAKNDLQLCLVVESIEGVNLHEKRKNFKNRHKESVHGQILLQ